MAHHRDPVGEPERLRLIVGHEHGGDADRALDGAQLVAHLLAELPVQRGQRLVEQQHARPVDERAGQGHALLHAAGQLGRAAGARGPRGAPGRGPRRPGARSPRRRRAARAARRPRSRRPTGAGRARRTGTPRRGPRRCGGRPVTSSPSMRMRPAVGLDEARDEVERGRLAAARRAEQREELALVARRGRGASTARTRRRSRACSPGAPRPPWPCQCWRNTRPRLEVAVGEPDHEEGGDDEEATTARRWWDRCS